MADARESNIPCSLFKAGIEIAKTTNKQRYSCVETQENKSLCIIVADPDPNFSCMKIILNLWFLCTIQSKMSVDMYLIIKKAYLAPVLFPWKPKAEANSTNVMQLYNRFW